MGAAPLSLVERIRVAGFNVMVARASYDIWWLYKGAVTRPLYIEGMRTYSEFFRFDEEAHFRAMIVGLCTLYDGRSDTVTLASIVKGTKAAGHDVTAIQAKLTALDDRVRKMKVLRHKLFAHRDHGMGYNDAYKAAGLAPDDVKAVLDESLSIVNRLAIVTGAQETHQNAYVTDHATELLRFIQPRP